jgi:hypothetical protein
MKTYVFYAVSLAIITGVVALFASHADAGAKAHVSNGPTLNSAIIAN